MNDLELAYQSTLDYLYSFVDFSLQRNFRYTPELFDLSRMFDLAALLGNPQERYPILHIAGTKGKGSVSSLCASALRAGGYRVGLYTSPHLDDYAERIQVDGQNIPHADLIALVEEIKPHIQAVPRLTTFEITTALAFLYFSRQGVNAAVIEVGLGGRLDATNICAPLVSVITSLSYDHTAILGSTLAQIAGEKAGIIKPGVPLILAPQQEEARQVVERIAAERAVPLYTVGSDFLVAPGEYSLDGQELLVAAATAQAQALVGDDLPQGQPARLFIPLLGRHQVENAAVAHAALLAARSRGLNLSQEQIAAGFRQVSWPGRFEVLRRTPPVVIDSAHNRDSACKLRQALADYFPDLPVILVFGASEDKDIQGMFAELLPYVRQVIVVKSFHPRAADPALLAEQVRQHGLEAQIVPDVADALGEALRLAAHSAVTLVAGSIFVAAGARIAWFNTWSKYEES